MDKDKHLKYPLAALDVAILGMGRLGKVIAAAMTAHGAHVTTWNRTPSDPTQQTPTPLPQTDITKARLIWLTVSDAAIGPMVTALEKASCLGAGQLVIHCAGRLDATILAPLQRLGCEIGSIHPLQPIAGSPTDAPGTPFAQLCVGVEGASEDAQRASELLAKTLGGQPFSLQGVDRAMYHAAAVFAANYTVTLADIGQQLLHKAGLQEHGLPLLLPLMQASLNNLASLGLPNALTGPISRCDQSTIEEHLKHLSEPHLSLYKALGHATIPIAQHQSSQIATDQWEQLAQLLDE